MKNIELLITACQAYKEERLGLDSFQSQLEGIYLPDICKNTLEKEQHNAYNQLEKIFYFYPQAEHRKYAIPIAEELIQAAKAEQKRLENYKPYQE